MIDNLTAFTDSLLHSLAYINNPKKRIYWLYLLSAASIASIYVMAKKQKLVTCIKKAISPKLWLSQSSLVDVQWLVINQVVRILLLVPLTGVQLALAFWINQQLYQIFGEGNFIHTSILTTSIMFTCVYFLFDDFSRFYVHYLYHKTPWLWRFHAIHHSANVLTPLTLYRIHSIEMVINSCRSLFVAGLVSGIFLYSFQGKISLIDILGANLFSFIFNMAGANLRHSSVWISYGKFEHWFISPAQHQIHHSYEKKHFDKNMGATLAVWDRLFGTFVMSENEKVTGYGIGLNEDMQSINKQFAGIKS